MEIKTKYNLNDHVWIVYAHQGEVCIYDTYIESMVYDSDGISYLTSELNDYLENEIILYDNKEELLKKIEEVMQKIHESEKEAKDI